MSRRRSLSEEEHALWAGFSRSITPLHRTRVAAAEREAGASPPRLRPEADHDAAKGKGAPPLVPLGSRLKRRVARGRESIDARLDLHGFTQTEAHKELLRFLRRAQADRAKIVLVVTGKGTGKPLNPPADPAAERGVLRRQVPIWLSLPQFRSLVVGFEDAHVGHGGAGALYVRLRRSG